MFGTLLASGAPRQPITRPAIIAGILHLVLVIGAVRLTAAAPSAAPVVRRDTIAFQLAPPRDPTPSGDGSAPPAPLAPAPLPLMEPSPAPRLELASPYGAADWDGLIRSAGAGLPADRGAPTDTLGLRFSTAPVDQPPELQGTLNPLYPERLRRAGISGSVQLEYVILPSGRVDSASIRVIANTEPAFAASVISAVHSASFKPARYRGMPVAVLVRQTIRFQNR